MRFGLSDSLFASALAHHNAGRLTQAEAGYRQALAVHPTHFQSLHMLGMLAGQTGRHQAALELADAAIAIDTGVGETHANRGFALMALGRGDEALASFDAAIRVKPGYAESHVGRANILRGKGEPEAAAASYRAALALHPGHAEAAHNLDLALQALDLLRRPAEGQA